MPPRLAGIICYICGREFGTKSIGIHEPQCMKKWEIQNMQLPKSKRLPKPVKPVEFDVSFSTNPQQRQAQIEKMNEAANAAAQENLVPCKYCQRTFLASRIEKHEAICSNVKNKPKSVMKPDEPYRDKSPVPTISRKSPTKTAASPAPAISSNQYGTMVKSRKSNESPGKQNNGSKQSTPSSTSDPKSNEMYDFVVGIKPELLGECSACGRMVLRNVMGMHVEKYCVNSKKEGSPTSPTTGKFVKGRFVDCINCGKSFTVNSLVVHQRKCLA